MVEVMGETTGFRHQGASVEAPGAALLITRWIKSGRKQLPPSSCREGLGEESGARIQESGAHGVRHAIQVFTQRTTML
jgi:hypothetical protein